MSIQVLKRRKTHTPHSGSRSADPVVKSAPVQSAAAPAGRIDFSAFLQPASVIERTLKERENPPGE